MVARHIPMVHAGLVPLLMILAQPVASGPSMAAGSFDILGSDLSGMKLRQWVEPVSIVE